MKMNPVVHFELPGEDMERMQKFYQNTFGWQTKEMGAEFGKYVTASTSETATDGFPKERGRINGGFFPSQTDAKVPTVVIAVDDINPVSEVHIVIIPKRHIESVLTVGASDTKDIMDMFAVAQNLVAQKKLTAFRLAYNGGSNQHVPHLHWHLLGD